MSVLLLAQKLYVSPISSLSLSLLRSPELFRFVDFLWDRTLKDPFNVASYPFTITKSESQTGHSCLHKSVPLISVQRSMPSKEADGFRSASTVQVQVYAGRRLRHP